MKKLLLFVACSIFYCSFAQLPPNSFGEDFTLTDINGNEFNLHSTLDEGKTVILDLFAVWCSPCWSFAETGVLDELQNEYPNDVVVVAVEADPSTPESSIDGGGNSVGNWETVIDYLLMDDPSGDVADDYALAYYPTIYKICPDRMVTEIGQGPADSQNYWTVSGLANEINSCSSAQYSKDARMLSYNGSSTYCGGTLSDASVTIQNYSIGAPLGDCDILTKINGQVVSTTPWSGNLDTYQTASVNIGDVVDIPNGANITFEVSYEGDMDTSNNSIAPSLSGSIPSSTNVSLYIMTDNWGSETSWELLNSNGNTIAAGNNYGNYEEIEEDWDLAPGCYIFNIYDSYGDGLEASMWGNYEDGSATLTDSGNNEVLWSGIQFEAGASVAFEVLAQSDIIETTNLEISMFPNPCKDYTNLSVYSKNAEEMNVDIINSLGKVIYTNKYTLTTGSNNVQIESGDFSPGLYYINVIIDGKNNLKPLTVVK